MPFAGLASFTSWWVVHSEVGRSLCSGVGILLTALMIPLLVARIRAEERLLRTQFGAECDGYCARTSRLIPRVY